MAVSQRRSSDEVDEGRPLPEPITTGEGAETLPYVLSRPRDSAPVHYSQQRGASLTFLSYEVAFPIEWSNPVLSDFPSD
jgi:hypothetical protein